MLFGIDLSGIPWAGLGGFLLGVGSFLSGWAALKLARDKGKEEEHEESSPGGADQRGSGSR